MLRHHPDDQQIVDLGKRQKGRVEEADEKQAGAPQREREPLDPVDETRSFPRSVD